jgi:hypothetical protein
MYRRISRPSCSGSPVRFVRWGSPAGFPGTIAASPTAGRSRSLCRRQAAPVAAQPPRLWHEAMPSCPPPASAMSLPPCSPSPGDMPAERLTHLPPSTSLTPLSFADPDAPFLPGPKLSSATHSPRRAGRLLPRLRGTSVSAQEQTPVCPTGLPPRADRIRQSPHGRAFHRAPLQGIHRMPHNRPVGRCPPRSANGLHLANQIASFSHCSSGRSGSGTSWMWRHIRTSSPEDVATMSPRPQQLSRGL